MIHPQRELPVRPDLAHLKKEARELQRAYNDGNSIARERVGTSLPRRADAPRLYLGDAQCVIAREYGFASWPRLKLHVESIRDPDRAAFVAVRLGDPKRLRAILDAHPELLTVRGEAGTLLHEACASTPRRNPRCLDVIETLLGAGADINATTTDGQTPLHWAASSDIARFLLEHGADPAKADQEGGTPLHYVLFFGGREGAELAACGPVDDNLRTAAALGRLDAMERHLSDEGDLPPSAGQHRQWSRPPWFPPSTPPEGRAGILAEALDYAVGNQRLDAARRLVHAGARFSAGAMTKVAKWGDDAIVQLLLDTKPDLATVLDWDWCVWQWANFAGHELLADRFKLLAAEQHLPSAADVGRLDRVDALLVAGADPSQPNHEGTTALALALGVRSLLPCSVDGGSPEVAARIRSAGGTLDFRSAAKLGELEVVENFLARGTSPNDGLRSAIDSGQRRVVECLVAAGAELDVFDLARLGDVEKTLRRIPSGFDWQSTKDGDTVLCKAIWARSTELVRALLERGAPVAPDGYGEFSGKAAVHIAGWAGAPAEIWDLLLEHGARINQGSDPGTPYDCARMARATDAMELIRERGGVSAEELGDYPYDS
jgi:ankyrin repeat protein